MIQSRHDIAARWVQQALSSAALRQLVSDLAGKIDCLVQEVEQLRLDNQVLKDEIARSSSCRRARPSKPLAWRKPLSRSLPNRAGV